MIFCLFLVISFLSILTLNNKNSKDGFIFFIVIIIYLISLIPSLRIPYIIDDMDHFYNLSVSLEAGNVSQWLFNPHNEHVIPLIKLFYFVFYKFFWLYPQPFHLLIFLICVGILFISYKLIKLLTKSDFSAFLFVVLLVSSNLLDLTIFIITDSHILFCLALFLSLFYAQHKYLEGKTKLWLTIIILTCVLLPATFSLGLTSIFFAFLFEKLCIPKDWRQKNGSSIPFVLIGWCIGIMPYLFNYQTLLRPEHYKALENSDNLLTKHFQGFHALKLLFNYLCFDLPLNILSNNYISFVLLCCILTAGIRFKQTIEWKKISFFLLFGTILSFIIYAFRAEWGKNHLSVSRYEVFPLFMLSGIYILICTPFFIKEQVLIKSKKQIIYLCCLLVLSYNGSIRYKHAQALADDTVFAVQNLYEGLNIIIVDYFKAYPDTKDLKLRDLILSPPELSSLATRTGFIVCLTRYARRISFYSKYVLPSDLNERIMWTENSTDANFLRFVESNRDKKTYKFAASLFLEQ